MHWIRKYFNKKITNENLFLNHLKTTYDFDEVSIIRKDDVNYVDTIEIIARSVLYQESIAASNTIEPDKLNPDIIAKLVNKILSEHEYLIIKLSRNYTMSQAYQYALFSSDINGYNISANYLTDINLFGRFPSFYGYSYGGTLTKNYRFIKNQDKPRLIPCYSIRYPLQKDGLVLNSYYNNGMGYSNGIQANLRDLEIFIEIDEIKYSTNYYVKLFYGSILLKEENIDSMLDYSLFLDEFLFPYNLTKDILKEVGIQLPLQFTPEFVKSMNKDFKIIVDMMKI